MFAAGMEKACSSDKDCLPVAVVLLVIQVRVMIQLGYRRVQSIVLQEKAPLKGVLHLGNINDVGIPLAVAVASGANCFSYSG